MKHGACTDSPFGTWEVSNLSQKRPDTTVLVMRQLSQPRSPQSHLAMPTPLPPTIVSVFGPLVHWQMVLLKACPWRVPAVHMFRLDCAAPSETENGLPVISNSLVRTLLHRVKLTCLFIGTVG